MKVWMAIYDWSEDGDNVRIVGLFSTKEKAEKAIEDIKKDYRVFNEDGVRIYEKEVR